MLSIKQLAQCMKHIKINQLSKELGVSSAMLVKVKNADQTMPYSVSAKVSDYFSGEHHEDIISK